MRLDVAVVTVIHNALSEAYFSSLDRVLSVSPLRVGVVIVDNASTACDVRACASRWLPSAQVFVRDRNYGFGHSNNFGSKQADAEYYFFLNPDTELHEPDVISKLHAFMEAHPDVGVAAPKTLYPDGRLQATCRRFPSWFHPFVQRTRLSRAKPFRRYLSHFLMEDFDHAEERDVDWAMGSALFIRRRTWETLGGFDERFFLYYEDVDLCRMARKAGWRVTYVPSASLLHGLARDSARHANPIRSLFKNKTARFHVASWLKYGWKWFGES